MQDVEKIKNELLTFPFELFDNVFSQRSFIDIGRINAHTPEAALNFIQNYGYDITIPEVADTVRAILNEAKAFISTYLLDDPEGKGDSFVMPPQIANNSDVLSFLVMASEKKRTLDQAWACAVLRVAHTITHVENDLAKSFMPTIRDQIFQRFSRHLFGNAQSGYYIGSGKEAIKLRLFEIKSEKTRESTILKLLHKKENVTADIFDQVGVRIVTYNKLDIILVLRYFATNHVLAFANVKPSRTRNNAVNIPRFIEGATALSKDPELANMTEQQVAEMLEKMLEIPQEERTKITKKIIEEQNIYSSTMYSSVQLTTRHLITIDNPMNPHRSAPYRFFFPFEVQILDEESYLESRSGRASHEEYKKSQTIAARKRVLANVIRCLRHENDE